MVRFNRCKDLSSSSPVPRLTQRIADDSAVPSIHQSPTSLNPVHPQSNPTNGAEAARPETAHKLPLNTHQYTAAGTVQPESNNELSAPDVVADSKSAQSESRRREKRKVTPTLSSTQPGISGTADISAPMPTQSETTSETDRKTTATTGLIQADYLSDKQKGKRKATSAAGLADPDLQESVASPQPAEPRDRLVEENGVPSANGDAEPLSAIRPTPYRIKDLRFSTIIGRIVPSGKRTNLRARSDYFTDREQLVSYTRFRDLVTALRLEGVYTLSSEQWLDLWQNIAYVLPRRGVIIWIGFYLDNEEHFWF